MAASVKQVMQAIELRLESIGGLNVTSYAADQVNPPQALVMVPPITYGGGLSRVRVEYEFTVVLLVSASLDREGQHHLADYADMDGPKSIRAALEDTDRTLGALVEDTQVTEFTPIGLTDAGQIGYYGGEFTVRVLAD